MGWDGLHDRAVVGAVDGDRSSRGVDGFVEDKYQVRVNGHAYDVISRNRGQEDRCGGVGGGGNGGEGGTTATAGTTNTGGGGGGRSSNEPGVLGASGGPGIVILRHSK